MNSLVAKEKGEVHWSDISPYIEKLFGGFEWAGAAGYNTGNNRNRAKNYGASMADWLHNNWNDIKRGTSPAKAYGGILVPFGTDENGDVIYKYALKKE